MENYEPKNFVDRTIVRAMGRNKTLDAQCNLTLPKDRAGQPYTFHAKGGKSDNPASSIRLNLTDYSEGTKSTGGQNVYVGYNLEPYMFSLLKDVAVKNLTTPTYPLKEGLWGILYNLQTFMTCVMGLLSGFLQIALTICRGFASGKDIKTVATTAGMNFKKLSEDLGKTQNGAANESADAPKTAVLPIGNDYTYSGEKVNNHKTNEQGMVPVSKILITCTNRTPKGEVQKYPWTIQIQNFWATPRYNQNGTTTYDSKTATGMKTAYIKLGNENMYSFCYTIEHFISVWEFMLNGGVLLSAENERFNSFNN